MVIFMFFILFQVLAISCDEKHEPIVDDSIISCHSTDFACFRTQYQYLRDKAVLGCEQLDLPPYAHYYFQYSDTNTCVKVSGVEASNLVGFSFDGVNKLLTLMMAAPVRFQQVWPNWTAPCSPPEKAFEPRGPHTGPYRKFAGNATMVVQFPFELVPRNGSHYLQIQNEDLDVTLDIPDLSYLNGSSLSENRTYEWSEWAYELVQRVDVPEHMMVPYLRRIKTIYTKMPLERFIVLYPSQKYQELGFKYVEPNVVQ